MFIPVVIILHQTLESAVVMFLPLTVFVLLLDAVVTRMVNSFTEVDEITHRASVSLSNGCSGTLISSNLIYTAAHCIQFYERIYVSHPSQPRLEYRIKKAFYPEDFRKGYDFYMRRDAYMRKCKICEQPDGPVAAAFRYPSISEQGKTYVPAAEKMECFTGFGEVLDINMGIIERMDGFEINSTCGKPHDKGVYPRFHKSDPNNPRLTNICQGDSGAGIQCISKGGTDLAVIGVAVRMAMDGESDGDKNEQCLAPHQSIALAAADHYRELYNKTLEWNEMANYNAVWNKCQAFLKQHPYRSVMHKYLGRMPEFY